MLQTGSIHSVFVSDFVDFSIYVDASEADLETWFLDRFHKLRETAFRDPASFFHQFAAMPEEEAMALAAIDLGANQPRQPARKHPADARTGAVDFGEGREPCGGEGSAAKDVKHTTP